MKENKLSPQFSSLLLLPLPFTAISGKEKITEKLLDRERLQGTHQIIFILPNSIYAYNGIRCPKKKTYTKIKIRARIYLFYIYLLYIYAAAWM